MTAQEKAARFRALHDGPGTFVIPNPWDAGTARILATLGFPALATTSAGLAFSRGLPDAAVPLALALEHLREIAAATSLPVNADFQAGYGLDPGEVGRSVRRCLDTGVAGLSVEDASGDPREPLFAFDVAVERVRAARAAIDAAGSGAVLTGRSEGFIVGRPDLEETIRRLRAYGHAGADCLYAPGLRTREEIAAVVGGVAPTPVNVLVAADVGLTVADLAALGVRRVSVGSALARVAWTAFIRAAATIAGEGRFTGFAWLTSYAELEAFFRQDLARRGGA
ncbi:MAG TPA: isocitrate lyase/phosphoenolpyruvate mutase family protein [Anaeromyxobacter sp.]